MQIPFKYYITVDVESVSGNDYHSSKIENMYHKPNLSKKVSKILSVVCMAFCLNFSLQVEIKISPALKVCLQFISMTFGGCKRHKTTHTRARMNVKFTSSVHVHACAVIKIQISIE